jgi:hypothetical protein
MVVQPGGCEFAASGLDYVTLSWGHYLVMSWSIHITAWLLVTLGLHNSSLCCNNLIGTLHNFVARLAGHYNVAVSRHRVTVGGQNILSGVLAN